MDFPPLSASVERPRRWGRTAAKAPEAQTPSALAAIPTPAQASAANAVSERVGKDEGNDRSRKGQGKGRGKDRIRLCQGPYAQGLMEAYAARYAADLRRLEERPDLPAGARWIDSHTHLESILQRSWRGGSLPAVAEHEPQQSLEELVASWPAGLEGCISNFAFRCQSKRGIPGEWTWLDRNLKHFEPESPLAAKLWFTIGIHPHDAGNWDAAAEERVHRLARHAKCVGIGECGLDLFKHDRNVLRMQLGAFRSQARLAVEHGKALVVHARLVTRENERFFFQQLRELVPAEHPVHMHCYGDSLENALALCENWPRLRIGFTGAVTFKDRSAQQKGKGGLVEKKGQAHCEELVRGLPLERLLIETDGPYMCPEPFRGQTSHPGHVHRVAEQIAAWKRCPLGEVMAATRRSTTTVYSV